MHNLPAPKPLLTIPRMILIAIILLVIGVVAFLLSVIYATPKVSVDYGAKVHQLVRERQGMPADAPNQWELITRIGQKQAAARDAVASRHPDWPPNAFDFTPIYRPDAKLSSDVTREQTIAAALEWLEEFRTLGGFDDLRLLPGVPFAARPNQDGPVINFLFPELGHMRSIARMNAARMCRAAHAGDHAERLAAFEQSLAIGRLVGAQQTLIDHLVGIAINALAVNELRYELIERPPNAAVARDLLAAIDRQKLPPLGPVFDTERFFSLDTIQRTYSDTGGGNGRYLPSAAADLGLESMMGSTPAPSTPRVFNLIGLLHPDRKSTEAKTKEVYDYLVKIAGMTRAERSAMSGPDPTTTIEGYKILELMFPGVGKALQTRDQIDADLAATRIILALEIHRAEHAAYPASLAELAPAILPTLPLDATNGKPFGYRVLAPGSDPHGRAYLLYSLGTDGLDNGGSMGPKPRLVLTPFQTPGNADFVYNQPRPAPEPPDPDQPPSAAAEAQDQQVEIAPSVEPTPN